MKSGIIRKARVIDPFEYDGHPFGAIIDVEQEKLEALPWRLEPAEGPKSSPPPPYGKTGITVMARVIDAGGYDHYKHGEIIPAIDQAQIQAMPWRLEQYFPPDPPPGRQR